MNDRVRPVAGALLAALLVAACSAPTPNGSPSSGSPSSVPSASGSASEPATATELPTATPEPPLSLELPPTEDSRMIRAHVAPDVAVDGGGHMTVTVTNLSTERVTELVLRWPTALNRSLFLAPFAPSHQRIADGGPPLLQDWSKWVVGPGERGEPAGTISLGWGPLDPGATLRITILVTRRAAGAFEFDLQLLAGEAILLLESGEPAELRVSVP